jgi:hypothetical protein
MVPPNDSVSGPVVGDRMGLQRSHILASGNKSSSNAGGSGNDDDDDGSRNDHERRLLLLLSSSSSFGQLVDSSMPPGRGVFRAARLSEAERDGSPEAESRQRCCDTRHGLGGSMWRR